MFHFGGFVTCVCSDITLGGLVTFECVMLHLEGSLHDCELNDNACDEENQVYEKKSSPVQFCRLKKN